MRRRGEAACGARVPSLRDDLGAARDGVGAVARARVALAAVPPRAVRVEDDPRADRRLQHGRRTQENEATRRVACGAWRETEGVRRVACGV